MFRRRIDVGSDSRDRAVGRIDASHAEIRDLHDLFVGSEQKVLRFDVAMNHAALVRVRESGANLFEIKQDSLKRQRPRFCECKKVAAGKILENDVMESRSGKIDGGAVSESIYHIWMSNTIERHCFVLKV